MPYLLLIISLLFCTACSDTQEHQTPMQKNETLKINSIAELSQVFKDLNYTSASWKAGQREVPRLYFSKISKEWKSTSDELSVKEKKNIFFRLITPLVLMSNEDIMKEKKRLKHEPKDSQWLKELAVKYRVSTKDDERLSDAQIKKLNKRVDIVPPSLALAQAAEESGWGTSRFAAQGNALFGQWDFSGKGMRPKEQRKKLGDYGLARFDTPLDSVKGYMLNLNTTAAYKKFRSMRQQLRQQDKPVTGWKLAESLDKYSERGQEYIDGLHQMMSYNKLQPVDEAYLSKGPTIHLVRSN